ncbi:MAG TPA: hypothetical protein VNL18_11485 [Gemmatimonadales bacterium]|nr:hypothetical protein [Gemmatimonadales bacterium]
MNDVRNESGFNPGDAPDRRVAERRSFASHRGIRVDRRAAGERRRSGDVALAPGATGGERRRGQDRRGASDAWPVERRSGQERRQPR